MIDDMGRFRVDVEVGHPLGIGERRLVRRVLVDTGAELSVIPATVLDEIGITRHRAVRFRQADGSVFERWIGSGMVYVAGTDAIDFLVFGEPSDIVLLGARTLEGLNLRVDPVSKQLVDAGPMDVAAL